MTKNIEYIVGRAENLMQKVDQIESDFYRSMVPLHENGRLRRVAGVRENGFSIRYKRDGNSLYYSENGFRANIPKSNNDGDYMTSNSYQDKYYNFKVKEDRLMINSHKGRKELLQLFPDLTVDEVVGKIEKSLEAKNVYKTNC